jgi:hypothetical protein
MVRIFFFTVKTFETNLKSSAMPGEAGGSVITFSRSKPHSSASITAQEPCSSNLPANTADQMSIESNGVEISSANESDGTVVGSQLHFI